jgi:integrase
MGYTRLRIDGRGERRYTAYFKDLRGRERSAGTFVRKRDADRAWRRAEAEIVEGQFVDLASGRQYFQGYVTDTWLPNHVMEIHTRQGYEHIITKYLMDGFGSMRMNEILPAHVRHFITDRHEDGATPHTLERCRTVLSAIFTTALNDRVIYLHPCVGVTTPTIPPRPPRILTPSEFTGIVEAMQAQRWQLLAELTVETGLRWGEVAELRASDFHRPTRTLTVARTVIELHTPSPNGERFLVKPYPKNAEYRALHLSPELARRVGDHIHQHQLDREDLLFSFPRSDPEDAANTVEGRVVPPGHGTMSTYTNHRCRCTACRAACADYRAQRRASGKDKPRKGKTRATDGHLPREWFRKQVWYPALTHADLPRRVRFHDLRHTNASWMLAGGADLQTVRERLGHRSLRATERYLHTLPGTGHQALTALQRIRHSR